MKPLEQEILITLIMETNLLSFEIVDLSELTGVFDLSVGAHDGCGKSQGKCGAGCGCGTKDGQCGTERPSTGGTGPSL